MKAMLFSSVCFAGLLAVAGCTVTEAKYERDGLNVEVYSIRVWTDTSASVSTPEGLSVDYSSDADSAGLQATTDRLLNVVLPPSGRRIRELQDEPVVREFQGFPEVPGSGE